MGTRGIIQNLLRISLGLERVRSRLTVGLLGNRIGKVGPAVIRPGNMRTLLWLQAVFGSVSRAVEPLMTQEPDVQRLLHIMAIIDVSTQRGKIPFEKGMKRVERLRAKLEQVPAKQLVEAAHMVGAALALVVSEDVSIGDVSRGQAGIPGSRNQ